MLIAPAILPILPVAQSLIVWLGLGGAAGAAGLWSLRHPSAWSRLARIVWRQKWGLLAWSSPAAIIAACLIWRVSPAAPIARASGDPQTAQWVHRGSLTRCGRRTGDRGPASERRVWAQAATQAFYSSPAIAGEQVFAIGCDGEAGRLFCWDLAAGRQAWASAPPDFRATVSSPVIAGDMLVCGEGLHDIDDARVLAIDLRAGQCGRLVWEFRTHGHVECTPVIADGKVYANAGDDGVYCLRLDRDLPPDQRLVWHLAGDRYPDVETSLAVHQGRAYVGLGVGGAALCVLDANDGAEIARLGMPAPVYGLPSIADGRLYVGMGTGDLLNSGTHRLGEVVCLDLATLGVAWTFETPDAVMGAVALDGGEEFFASADGTLFRLSASGRELRRWESHSRIVTSPALDGERAYVVSSDGMLTALDQRLLQPVLQMRIGEAGAYVGSPVVAAGHVYVGTPADGFQCVGVQSPVVDDLWPGDFGGPGRAGSVDRMPVGDHGHVLWTFAGGAGTPDEVTSAAAVTPGAIVYGAAAPGWVGLRCLENQGSDAPRQRWAVPLRGAVRRSPVITAGLAIAADVVGGANGSVEAINLTTGQAAWSWPLAKGASGCLMARDDMVLVGDAPQAVSAVSLDGRRLWSRSWGRIDYPVELTDSMVIAAASEPPALIASDRETGLPLWSTSLPEAPSGPPVVDGRRILVPLRSGLVIRSLLDGSAGLEGPTAGEFVPASNILIDSQRIAIIDSAGRLIECDRESGRLNKAVPGFSAASALLAASNRALAANGSLLLGLDWADSESRVETWAALPGRVTTPPVLSGRRVYLGVERQGLVCLGDEEAP